MTASIVFIWLSLNNNITSGWIKIEKMLTNVGKTWRVFFNGHGVDTWFPVILSLPPYAHRRSSTVNGQCRYSKRPWHDLLKNLPQWANVVHGFPRAALAYTHVQESTDVTIILRLALIRFFLLMGLPQQQYILGCDWTATGQEESPIKIGSLKTVEYTEPTYVDPKRGETEHLLEVELAYSPVDKWHAMDIQKTCKPMCNLGRCVK